MGTLYSAARRGDNLMVSALLDQGADPNETGDKHGTTALTIAAGMGHVEVVRLLVEHGADVDRPNKFGARPLFVAATNAKLDVIRRLLKAGASVSLEADGGLTPFMKAAKSTPDTVRVFLKHGVDVNAVSSKGYTALQCAAINDLHGPAIIPLLLDAGADPEHRDNQGRTARELALERGREENAAALDAHNSRFPTPLGYAWRGNWKARLRELVATRGHGSVSEYVDAHPLRSLRQLADDLGGGEVVAVQLETVLVDEARVTGALGRRARDLMARAFAAMLKGRSEPVPRKHEHEEPQLPMLSSWLPHTIADVETERVVAFATSLLQSPDLPPGWRPSGPDDPVIIELFERHWPR